MSLNSSGWLDRGYGVDKILVMGTTDEAPGEKLTAASRLQADSAEVVVEAMQRAVLDIASRAKFRGRKLRPGPAMNALAIWLAELPVSDRAAFMAGAVARLEKVLEGDPVRFNGVGAPEPIEIELTPVNPPAKARKKSG